MLSASSPSFDSTSSPTGLPPVSPSISRVTSYPATTTVQPAAIPSRAPAVTSPALGLPDLRLNLLADRGAAGGDRLLAGHFVSVNVDSAARLNILQSASGETCGYQVGV